MANDQQTPSTDSTTPTVRPFSGTPEEWDHAVGSLPGGTFCHLWGWGTVFKEALGHETSRWVTRDHTGRIDGLLPLVRLRSALFGQNLLSMPFLNYGGPIGAPRSRAALVNRAASLGEAAGDQLVELRARSPVETDLPVSTEKVTVVLPLPEEAEELWEGLKSKVRSQVRRPRKEGMRVAYGIDLMNDFYSVFACNMRDLGTPVLPRSLFDVIARVFSDELIVATVVAADGTTAAAGCGFLHEGEFELTWASALRDYNRQAPNMLLYWSLMEEVIRRGGRTFNFGRCTPGSGTHRFKLQWGGRDEQLYWIRWSQVDGGGPPSTERGLYSRAVSIWKRMPLPIANRVGPWISKGLPTW